MNNIRLFIAWIWVALPLGWGVYQSVNKSLPLFRGGAAPAAAVAPAH
ncbi:MFS transporter small subunit [Brevifollis gellanilyticus]|uniref:Oxalate:formate antiporter n=1 Tax=Brevifollis gellanilyticus TaxID=748831 RepID=A0A512M6A7_9BACT|nr:hypothetical protein [Brevifollis gellanilyticus]GEP42263.1 hypothetical protein BGE01nite_15540 [Brevifollis gellanilyticus]